MSSLTEDSWPEKGELDLVEGVNMFTHNAMSAHTKNGFIMKPRGFTSKFMLESEKQNNCGVAATDDQGKLNPTVVYQSLAGS